MCLNCETDSELDECAFDADEHHPSDWPDDATPADMPDDVPEPQAWHDEKGKPYDNNYTLYHPYQGSQSPTVGRCNAPLTNYEERYGEIRYCMRLPEYKFGGDSGDSEFCHVHKNREQLMERASEIFTHGLFSKTIRHTFEHLSAWQQLTVLGWYDAYVQESQFSFDPKFESFELDFSEFGGELPIEVATMLDENETLAIDVPVPQEHENRCYALYRAAIMDMKAGLADRVTLDTGDDSAVMERETVVSVTDEGRTITDKEEHHLNLPLSRLDKNRKELLTFGGVAIDGANGDLSVNVNGETTELIMDLDEGDDVGGDTNPVEEAMVEDADGDHVDDTSTASRSSRCERGDHVDGDE